MAETTQTVSLGCGTFILIAIIVMIFTNNDDGTKTEIRQLREEVHGLREDIKSLRTEIIRQNIRPEALPD